MKRAYFLTMILALLWLSPEIVFAQEAGPKVTSIRPAVVEEGQEHSILINGEHFSGLIIVTIENQDGFSQTLPATLKSDSVITAELSLAPAAGDYRLCVNFTSLRARDCQPFQVIQGQLLEVVSIEPTTIFGTVDTKISIVIKGTSGNSGRLQLSDIVSVWLDDTKLEIIDNDKKGDVVEGVDQYTIPVQALAGIPAGEKNLKVVLKNGQEAILEPKITVMGPINAQVTTINPDRILLFEEKTITVTGNNFASIAIINWPLDYVACGTSPEKCDQILVSSNELRLTSSPFANHQTGDISGTIQFLDGSSVKIPTIKVLDRVFPWDSNSWTLFVLSQIGFGLVWLSVYRNLSKGFDAFIADKTAPEVSNTLTIVATGLGIASILFIVAYVSSGVLLPGSTVGFSLSTAMIGLNISLVLIFLSLNNKFYEILPRVSRPIIALAAIAVIFIIPIIATNTLQPNLAIIGGALIFIIVAALGTWGVETARQRLESQKIKGPPDEVIYNRVEEKLFIQGQLDAANDFSELPRDRVISAFSKYYSNNRSNFSIEFSDIEGTLQFPRYQNIQTIQAAFAQLRSLLASNKQLTTADIENLESVLRQEFGFQRGQGLEEVKSSDTFFAYAIRPVGVESILPNPFPLLVHASPQPISNEELGELQDILNRLDIKTRFALLISVSEPAITRERIRTRFGGAGRENIVVLGEKDCKEIIVSTDEMRLSFMRVLQKQVDLMIFSPYGVKGPTSLDMFFGRKQEISTVLERISVGSVAVLGARRIGKTSMLQACQRILVERGKLLLYLDCYQVFDYDDWLQRVKLDWNPPDVEPVARDNINDFPLWLSKLQAAYSKKQIVFLLDEIDQLMAYDKSNGRGEKLFRLFRSLAQEKRCQFIFSGERTILDQLSNPKSPFFNFAVPISLGVLERKIVDQMIIEPMSLIGTTLIDENEILELVFNHTSGHPNLVQFVCQRCLEILSQQKTRILDPETVRNVVTDTAYKDQYLTTYWSQATPLEKAISIVVAETNHIPISSIMNRLKEAGFQPGIDELQKGLRYLTLSQLLIAEGNNYSIQPSMFIEALSSFSFSAWLEDLLREHNSD